jgi:hypothetical protein
VKRMYMYKIFAKKLRNCRTEKNVLLQGLTITKIAVAKKISDCLFSNNHTKKNCGMRSWKCRSQIARLRLRRIRKKLNVTTCVENTACGSNVCAVLYEQYDRVHRQMVALP